MNWMRWMQRLMLGLERIFRQNFSMQRAIKNVVPTNWRIIQLDHIKRSFKVYPKEYQRKSQKDIVQMSFES